MHFIKPSFFFNKSLFSFEPLNISLFFFGISETCINRRQLGSWRVHPSAVGTFPRKLWSLLCSPLSSFHWSGIEPAKLFRCVIALRLPEVPHISSPTAITATPAIRDGRLLVRGKAILSEVPDNVSLSPIGASSAFLGADSASAPSSRHVFTLGVLESVSRSALSHYANAIAGIFFKSSVSAPFILFFLLFQG